jgi:mannose-6-phosphate isomerase-like protein (cupin superfamily)
MKIRCVVTGYSPSGKSVFVSDAGRSARDSGDEVRVPPGVSDTKSELPSDGTAPTCPGYFPPADGSASSFSPFRQTRGAARREWTGPRPWPKCAKAAGPRRGPRSRPPGHAHHRHGRFDVVLSGEVYLELDDGADVLLKPGDCVIQNGTRHAWHNRSSEDWLLPSRCWVPAAPGHVQRQSIRSKEQPQVGRGAPQAALQFRRLPSRPASDICCPRARRSWRASPPSRPCSTLPHARSGSASMPPVHIAPR